MGSVTRIRKTVLPENVFKAIEKYMHGQYVSLHILAIDDEGNIEQITAGDVPSIIKQHDTKARA